MVLVIAVSSPLFASTETVREQEPKYKVTSAPSENLFIKKTRVAVDRLVANVTAGYAQGVDSNPLLDSTHKADSYSEESVDMHYIYPVFGSALGFTDAKFGFSATNINYYRQTDVSMFDGVADINVEREISDNLLMNAGYAIEDLWFPHSADGTYIGSQFNIGAKQKLNSWAYTKASYTFIMRYYTSKKAYLGTLLPSDMNRFDKRNVFDHEVGVYIGDSAKLKLTNQIYVNHSNDQYFDYYDYLNYRLGGSIIKYLTKKLSNVSSFYYQRRNYFSRKVSDRDSLERDNLWLATTSFMYDYNKNLSFFVNYTHSENHTNEPLEQFVDTIFSGGLYYSF